MRHWVRSALFALAVGFCAATARAQTPLRRH
jgi:hypothetical protein